MYLSSLKACIPILFHLYNSTGIDVVQTELDSTNLTLGKCPIEKGFCVLPNGGDQNSGVIKLNNVDGDTEQAQATCLDLCKKRVDATGCEVIWHQGNRGCYVHTKTVDRGNGVDRHMCWIFSKCKTVVLEPTPRPGRPGMKI